MSVRRVEIQKGVLGKNDELARALRERLHQAGLLTLNLVSSPGSGKTRLLERTLREMAARGGRPAALVGDLATDNDARRLARSGVPVRQIETRGRCHLEAAMISEHLQGWTLEDFHYLFIENVGNLVCPASYDLGEDLRIVLLSVTEGEDKPLKYPSMFQSADAVVLTKVDLAEACEFDTAAFYQAIRSVCPGVPVMETSARTGQGLDAWMAFLRHQRAGRPAPIPVAG